jgi:uncharacterized protein YyaL (SSP411 family)
MLSRIIRRSILIFLFLIGLSSAIECRATNIGVRERAGAPDAAPYSSELRGRLDAALAAKGPEYRPRSRHLASDGSPKFSNRLILEDSPYLLQHAHNPVDWFPWGAEAFAKARHENKPIFLSIGYSTCHWCHVMEEESFDNIAIARLLNKHFVSIKVDRERRPDVDKAYMTAVMVITGRGGWPLSSFLTPAGKFFYGGTYFTPDQFAQLLDRVGTVWQEQRADLVAQADEIAAAVRRTMEVSGQAREIGDTAIKEAVARIVAEQDSINGGFGQSPKFPNEPFVFLLLETAYRSGDKQALSAAESSLTAMAHGGIFDQVGGGFHRYSTDARWLVPHFEKMLYNQALLGRAYVEAYQLTGKQLYARVASQTLDFVLRDMTGPEGGFYSAFDADSEGEEGTFYLWDTGQIQEALHSKNIELARDVYAVTEEGNFEGKNILYLPVPLEVYAKRHNVDQPQLLRHVDRVRDELQEARARRVPPLPLSGGSTAGCEVSLEAQSTGRWKTVARLSAGELIGSGHPGRLCFFF